MYRAFVLVVSWYGCFVKDVGVRAIRKSVAKERLGGLCLGQPEIGGIAADKEYLKARLVMCGEESAFARQLRRQESIFPLPLSSTLTVRQSRRPHQRNSELGAERTRDYLLSRRVLLHKSTYALATPSADKPIYKDYSAFFDDVFVFDTEICLECRSLTL